MGSPTSEMAKASAAAEGRSNLSPSGHQLEKIAQDVGTKVGTMASDFSTSTTNALKASRDYVKENPATGVAIAAAAGLVAGSLLTMAFRRTKH